MTSISQSGGSFREMTLKSPEDGTMGLHSIHTEGRNGYMCLFSNIIPVQMGAIVHNSEFASLSVCPGAWEYLKEQSI